MPHTMLQGKIAWLILTYLLVKTTSLCFGCPKECKCERMIVHCNGRGLTKIPDGIPINLVFLDLTDNPLLQFKEDFLLKFKHLEKLVMNNCSVNHSFYIPNLIVQIELRDNHLSASIVRRMFNKELKFLVYIDLSNNNLELDECLPVLPNAIRRLIVEGNNLKIFKEKHLKTFLQLSKLSMARCKLKRIEPQAFDTLKNLRKVDLSFNELEDLPDKLFGSRRAIEELYLLGNHLKILNMSSLGIDFIRRLNAMENRIVSFEVKSTIFISLDLSSNLIENIEDGAFEKATNIIGMYLQNNKISKISRKAFSKVKNLGTLCLETNQLQMLPEGLFDGMAINRLFLHENNLTNLQGVLSGMKHPPSLLLLSSNPNWKLLNATEFSVMTENSAIFLTCKNFDAILGMADLKASIKCSPSSDLVIKSNSRTLSFEGFECTYNKTELLFFCKACSTGQFASMKHCLDCPAGSFYQDEVGRRSCKSCPLGQYVPPELSPGKKALDCKTCPKGTVANSLGGTRACKCLDGFSRIYRFGECQRCIQQGFDCKRDYPELKRGYWMSWASMTSEHHKCKKQFEDFVYNLETFNDDYNRSTMYFNCKMPIPHKCPIIESCLGGTDATCAAGYTDVLCAVCDEGYSRQLNRCNRCPKPIVAILQFLGYILLFAFVCLLISWTDKKDFGIRRNDTVQNETCDENRTFADAILSSFKILLGFYQVLVTILNTLAYIYWPTFLQKAVGMFQYFEFDFFQFPGLNCINENWKLNAVDEFWFTVLVIVAVPFGGFAYFIIKICIMYIWKGRGQNVKGLRRLCAGNSFRVVALFLFTAYPLTSRRIIQILPASCHSLCIEKRGAFCLNETSHLRSDYSVKCLSMADEKVTLITAYACLFIPIGLPVALWFLLRRHAKGKNHSRERRHDGCHDLNVREGRILTSALKFVFENYKDSYWYWEVVEMARKLIMTTVMVIFLPHTKIGLASIIIISMLFIFPQAAQKPFKDDFENFAQLVSLSLIPINLSICAVLQSQFNENSDIVDKRNDVMAIGIVLVVMNSLLVILVVGRLIKRTVQKIRN